MKKLRNWLKSYKEKRKMRLNKRGKRSKRMTRDKISSAMCALRSLMRRISFLLVLASMFSIRNASKCTFNPNLKIQNSPWDVLKTNATKNCSYKILMNFWLKMRFRNMINLLLIRLLTSKRIYLGVLQPTANMPSSSRKVTTNLIALTARRIIVWAVESPSTKTKVAKNT